MSNLTIHNNSDFDTQLTSKTMSDKLQFYCRAGPTYNPLPAFDWSTSDLESTVPHIGQPTRWTFKPIQHDWSP